jgi:hypothetical protein
MAFLLLVFLLEINGEEDLLYEMIKLELDNTVHQWMGQCVGRWIFSFSTTRLLSI